MSQTSILDGIRVASPCPASWEAMQGDDRIRFCSECRKDVYNLSVMTIVEASALIAEREGQLCARLYRRADGTVLTADCPVGVGSAQKDRLRKLLGLGMVGLAMASTGVAALGFSTSQSSEPSRSKALAMLDDWVNQALIKIGWRKPRPTMTLGVIMSIPQLRNAPPPAAQREPDPNALPDCIGFPKD